MDLEEFKDDTITEEAKARNYVMSKFDSMREYELWRYFQGLDSAYDEQFLMFEP